MKKIICLALILLSVFSVFGQTEKIITEVQFITVLESAEKQSWESMSYPYRITYIQEIIFDFKGKTTPFQLIKSILEKDKNRQSHYSSELTGHSGLTGKLVNWKYESISSGRGKFFERNDDGNWFEVPKLTKLVVIAAFSPLKTRSNPVNLPNITENSIEYKYLGNEQINNQKTDIYASFEKYKKVETSGAIILRIETKKYWINKDGAILKLDFNYKIDNGGNISNTHVIQSWEKLDPFFEIKIPELPNPQ